MDILKRIDKVLEESSYTEFLTSYGNDIKTAVKQLKELSKISNSFEEDFLQSTAERFSQYDEDIVIDIMDGWIFNPPTVDEIAETALRNQDRHGTEPRQVLHAIEDIYDFIKRKV